MKKILLIFIIFILFSIVGFCSTEWISPTGFSDPDTIWNSEENTYDGNLGTSADSYNGTARTWGGFLELNIDQILCKKIRFYAFYSDDITEIDIDLYYENAWNDLYEGVFIDQTWVEKSMTNYMYVTKARVRFYAKKVATAYFYEFEFEQYTFIPVGSVTFVDVTEVTINADTSITMQIPSGASEDDLLIAYIAKDDNVAIYNTGDYANWNMLVNETGDSQTCLYVAWRIATAGDVSGAVSWTWNADSEDWVGEILCYSGADETNPIHASGSDYLDSSDAPTAPSVDFTGLTAGSLVLQVFGCDFDDTPRIVPGELTSRFNQHQLADIGGAGGDRSPISGDGNTGTAIFGIPASNEWTAATLVIETKEAVVWQHKWNTKTIAKWNTEEFTKWNGVE